MALTQVRPAGLSTGSVLQVKSTTKTDIASFSSSSTSEFVDLSGLSVSITPISTSNKILVMFTVNVAQSTTATVHVRLARDSTAIYIGDQGGTSSIRSSVLVRNGGTPYAYEIPNLSGTHLDSPNTTSAVTYKVQYASRNSGKSIRFNGYSGTSTIQLMEISA